MIDVDENGRRLITLEAVRHEIRSAGGRIDVMRLFSIFDVDYRNFNNNNNNTARADTGRSRQFREVIQELGTVDPYRIDLPTCELVLLAYDDGFVDPPRFGSEPHLIPPDDGFLD